MIKIPIDTFVINKNETLKHEIKTEIEKLQNLLQINKGKKYKQHYQKKTVINVSNKSLIKECLNKFTNETYETNILTIINLINNYEDKTVIAEDIFNICKNNIFYSELYSKLYYELIINKQLLIFKQILDERKDELIELYNKIEYVDAEINYDKFCKNNKLNESIKSITTFYAHLYNKTLIDVEFIYSLIFFLIDKIKATTNDNVIFEMIENLRIIISLTYQKIMLNSDYTKMKLLLNNIKNKEEGFKHIKNKTLFKCMDILDLLNN